MNIQIMQIDNVRKQSLLYSILLLAVQANGSTLIYECLIEQSLNNSTN